MQRVQALGSRWHAEALLPCNRHAFSCSESRGALHLSWYLAGIEFGPCPAIRCNAEGAHGQRDLGWIALISQSPACHASKAALSNLPALVPHRSVCLYLAHQDQGLACHRAEVCIAKQLRRPCSQFLLHALDGFWLDKQIWLRCSDLTLRRRSAYPSPGVDLARQAKYYSCTASRP